MRLLTQIHWWNVGAIAVFLFGNGAFWLQVARWLADRI
jgi:hypothetical protein